MSLAAFSALPFADMGMNYGALLFLFQFVLLSYFAWYRYDLIADRAIPARLIAAGLALGLVVALPPLVAFDSTLGFSYLNSPWKLPSMLIGSGLLLLALRRAWFSKAVNKVSSGVLAAYLLLTFPVIAEAVPGLQSSLIAFDPWLVVLCGIGCSACILVLGIAVDTVRQLAFQALFSRHPYHLFDLLIERVSRAMRRLTDAI